MPLLVRISLDFAQEPLVDNIINLDAREGTELILSNVDWVFSETPLDFIVSNQSNKHQKVKTSKGGPP